MSANSLGEEVADAYLFHCATKTGCEYAAQEALNKGTATLAVDDPQEGTWRVLVRTRNGVARPMTYHIETAILYADVADSEKADTAHIHAEAWSLVVPPNGRPLYAAFRIAGTPGNAREKNGLRIAMTPLAPNAP